MREEIGCHIPICGFAARKVPGCASCEALHSPMLFVLPNVPSVLMKCDLIRIYQVMCLT